jgi:hypothetical protein
MDYNNLSSVLRLGRIGSIARLRPPVFSRGTYFCRNRKNPVTERSVVSTNLQGTFL